MSSELSTGQHWKREKEHRIRRALFCDPVDLTALQELALSYGGLLDQYLRKKAWPKLLGINVFYISPYEGTPLSNHKERPQVLLDVNRCGKRIPQNFTEEERKTIQGQLERVILRLLAENPCLHYYQGLHDVVLTFLLVTGEELAYAIMNVLVRYHIRDFLDDTMDRTKVIIGCLSPLLALEDPHLETFITRSECAYYFSLSWLITWYGHVVQTQDAHRLADVFLASHPLLPVYVAAAIILTRRAEVLEVDCELSAVHGLLSKLPPHIEYEQMVAMALQLFKKHPPHSLARKGNPKLRQSALVNCYPTFCREIRFQRPDYILKDEPPPPPRWHDHATWWVWLTGWTTKITLRTVLSVIAPILIATAVYFYTNPSRQHRSLTF